MPRRWPVRTAAATVSALAAGWLGLLAAPPAHADIARNAEQWVISDLALHQAWAHTQGSGVTVAVIDSGVNPSVSDLAGSVIPGPDYSGVSTPPSNPNWGVHGTWMASLIAGHGHGGGNGIEGAAPQSRVLSIRVITDAGDPNYSRYQAESAATGQSELAEAIRYAVNNHAGVISMSLGYSMNSVAVRSALQFAYDHNVVVVASAGNSGNSAGAAGSGHAPYSYPADYPGVLGVAAVNAAGQVASFSSENLSVLVAAPGARVPAQGRDGQYWYVSGTSPACALAAGVVALIKSAYPDLTDQQVISAITTSTTVRTRPPGGWDEQIGFGEVNAAQALAAAGTIAASSQPATGLAARSHFGGGPAAVPPAPVAPRGPAAVIAYVLVAVASLALIGFATSRMFSPGGSTRRLAGSEVGSAGPAGPPDFSGAAGPTGPFGSGRLTRPYGSAGPPLSPSQASRIWPGGPGGSAGPGGAPATPEPAGRVWPFGPPGPSAPPPGRPAPDPSGPPPEDDVTRPLWSPDGNWPEAGPGPAGNGSSDGSRPEPPGHRPAAWPAARPQPRHAGPRGGRPGQPERP